MFRKGKKNIAWAKKNLNQELLNSDNGGGGGAAFPKSKRRKKATPSESSLQTPEAQYSLEQTQTPGGTEDYKVHYTPGIREISKKVKKEFGHVIYMFKKVGESDAYIGRTCDPIKRCQK